MTDKEAYKNLEERCPTGYRINELIKFCYPIRRIKMNVLVNKSPDGSLLKVYIVILRAIQIGFDTQDKLFNFLGLNKDDEFIYRELYALREKCYVDIVSEKWFVTNDGEEFIKNEKILRIEENEDFDFFIDGISGEIMAFDEEPEEGDIIRKVENGEKQLKAKVDFPIKSPELVNEKFPQLAELFKQKNKDETLISYISDEIKRDYREWCSYWLIEYIPENSNTSSDARLEIRSLNTLKEVKFLTKRFNEEYQDYIYELTDSDRKTIEELPEIVEEANVIQESHISTPDFETLGIWKTKQSFIEALGSVKEKILIESPWIKQATREYIPYFDKLLNRGKRLVILYGMADKDEHDYNTMKKLEELQKQYSNFKLIHLPTHFESNSSKLTGTHRKLMIKDNEYYISGSFNFLSFGKQESQKVSNEESHLIRKNVKEKWESVMKEYSLSLS
jgi:hypothetical protein